MGEHPVLRHFRGTSAPDARLISDFLSRRAFHRLGIYREFFAHVGVEDQLTALISAPVARVRAGISIDRGRPRFDEYDRRVLDLLQPHLRAARDNAIRFSEAIALPLASASAGSELERLTDRQRTVLAHVACGFTDARIALELGISANTVRKHVEHILRRLATPTRTAAAAVYLTSRDAPPSPRWTAAVPALAPPT
jgi:DNA-binding CsgD family transcriptional regulator